MSAATRSPVRPGRTLNDDRRRAGETGASRRRSGQPRSIHAAVPGALISLTASDPAASPLDYARVPAVHVHLGAPAAIAGVFAGRRFSHVANPGDLSVVPRGCDSREDWSDAVSYLSVRFDEDEQAALPTFLPLQKIRGERVSHPARRAATELLSEHAPDPAVLEELMLRFAHALASAIQRHDGRSSSPDVGRRERRALSGDRLRQVVERIHDESDTSLTVADLAASAGLSKSHFARSFTARTGLSPHQYLLRVRLRRAEHLLAFTDMSISDVAHRVGFAHQSHLHRHFVRWTGVTPSQFVAHHTGAARSAKRSFVQDL